MAPLMRRSSVFALVYFIIINMICVSRNVFISSHKQQVPLASNCERHCVLLIVCVCAFNCLLSPEEELSSADGAREEAIVLFVGSGMTKAQLIVVGRVHISQRHALIGKAHFQPPLQLER